jgi:hypothetical protein
MITTLGLGGCADAADEATDNTAADNAATDDTDHTDSLGKVS